MPYFIKIIVHVKKTQTEVEEKDGPILRWYHIAATVGVLILVVIALIKIFSIFDLSLVGSRYTLRYALGCTTSITGKVERSATNYRYAGANNGMMIGKKGITNKEDEAYLKIIELGTSRVKITTRNHSTSEWEEEKEINYGSEYSVPYEEAPDCMPGISYTINR